MTERFLRNVLSLMGEEESLTKVKIIKNKYTGETATYGFLQFESDAAALMVMHKLNGKIIPNSQPPVRFQLNHASAKQSGSQYSDREYSIWVSDLPSDITEEEFKKTFSTRYDSIRSAKLMDEKDGKRFGFVRFGDMNDQREALIHMNGFPGLGQPPIRVSMAIPKPCLSEASALAEKQSAQYSHMYENYQADRAAWGNYGAFQSGGGGGSSAKPALVSGSSKSSKLAMDWDLLMMSDDNDDSDEEKDIDDEYKIIDHDAPVNVDAMNAEFIERSQEVWDAVERDRWIYNLENDEGMAPNFRKKSSKKKLAKVLNPEPELPQDADQENFDADETQ